MIDTILKSDASIQTIANIGCRYAFLDHYLASHYPAINWICVDNNPTLTDLNSEFNLSNLKFNEGYALQLIRNRMIDAELTFFSSTATLIPNLELREYCASLNQYSKYIIFNEPIFPDFQVTGFKSKKCSLNQSIPMHLYRMGKSSNTSELAWLHDYVALLDESGYDCFSSTQLKPKFLHYSLSQIVGIRRSC